MALVKNRAKPSIKAHSITQMANYVVTAFKKFLADNHDFSTGKGPEIRDWQSGGHSLFLHKGNDTVRVDSPLDPAKLSVAFIAKSLNQNADSLIVISGVNEEGKPYNTVIDKVDFAPDTQTSAADWGM